MGTTIRRLIRPADARRVLLGLAEHQVELGQGAVDVALENIYATAVFYAPPVDAEDFGRDWLILLCATASIHATTDLMDDPTTDSYVAVEAIHDRADAHRARNAALDRLIHPEPVVLVTKGVA